MFEGDSADICTGKILLVSMGGRAEGLACTNPGVRTPIGAGGIFVIIFLLFSFLLLLCHILFSQKDSCYGS
jgi:hypothetical protein